jgi:hypothetical protein
VLKAGRVHGVTAGSVFELFAPGTKEFDQSNASIGRAEITDVSLYEAVGQITEGGNVPQYSRAVERDHNYADRKLNVHIRPSVESETLKNIELELVKFPFIELTPEETNYHLLLREESDHIIIEAGDPTAISPHVPTNDPDAVRRVVEQVSQWARWFNVLSIENPSPQFDIDFKIDVVRDGETRSPYKNMGQADIVLDVGEEFQITVENKSNRELFLSMIDLSSDGAIDLVSPSSPGAQDILAAQGKWSTTLQTTLPTGRDSVKDVLKVIATTEPVDLSFLSQTPVRTATRVLSDADPLSQLIANAATGLTRGVTRINLESWVTTERIIEVVRP